MIPLQLTQQNLLYSLIQVPVSGSFYTQWHATTTQPNRCATAKMLVTLNYSGRFSADRNTKCHPLVSRLEQVLAPRHFLSACLHNFDWLLEIVIAVPFSKISYSHLSLRPVLLKPSSNAKGARNRRNTLLSATRWALIELVSSRRSRYSYIGTQYSTHYFLFAACYVFSDERKSPEQ